MTYDLQLGSRAALCVLHSMKMYEQVTDSKWPFNTVQENTKRPMETSQMVTTIT